MYFAFMGSLQIRRSDSTMSTLLSHAGVIFVKLPTVIPVVGCPSRLLRYLILKEHVRARPATSRCFSIMFFSSSMVGGIQKFLLQVVHCAVGLRKQWRQGDVLDARLSSIPCCPFLGHLEKHRITNSYE